MKSIYPLKMELQIKYNKMNQTVKKEKKTMILIIIWINILMKKLYIKANLKKLK